MVIQQKLNDDNGWINQNKRKREREEEEELKNLCCLLTSHTLIRADPIMEFTLLLS